jgi:hypothetical protein
MTHSEEIFPEEAIGYALVIALKNQPLWSRRLG